MLVVSINSTTEELVIEVLEMTDGGFFVGRGFDRLNHRIFVQPPKNSAIIFEINSLYLICRGRKTIFMMEA